MKTVDVVLIRRFIRAGIKKLKYLYKYSINEFDNKIPYDMVDIHSEVKDANINNDIQKNKTHR